MPHLKASDKARKNIDEESQNSAGEGDKSITNGEPPLPQTKSDSVERDSQSEVALATNEGPSMADTSKSDTVHQDNPEATQSPYTSAPSRASDNSTSYGHDDQPPASSENCERGDRQLMSSPNRPIGSQSPSLGPAWTPSSTKKRTHLSKEEEGASTQESTTVSPETKSLPEGTNPESNGLSIKRRKVSEMLSSGDQSEGNQRIISPSSSSEGSPRGASGKSNDDEIASTQGRKTSTMESTEHAQTQHLGSPPDVRYGNHPVHPYHAQYYPPRHIMYGYPPIPHHAHLPPPPRGPHHHGISQPPPPVWRYPHYPSAPGHPGAYPPPYPTPYAPQHPSQHPQHYHPKAIPAAEAADGTKSQSPQHTVAGKTSTKSNTVTSSKKQEDSSTGGAKIKSVAEWQQAALATGKAPSANRCIQLKSPIPSKYWGEAEKTKDAPIPDFHQLVNFPDYLNKVRSNGAEAPGSSASSNGKRPCVMCGRQRICSASTANLGGSVLRRGKKSEDSVNDEDEDEDSNHIIPRQNKGLCTACDVTVWVVVDTALEIKWCKGCKNFRPWAAFGDKGLATKCVRCRDRQREKYALQKDDLRLRRIRQNSGKRDRKLTDQQHEMDAAKGLRDLMAATSHV